jgi:cobalamin-dependent methionine synthase I
VPDTVEVFNVSVAASQPKAIVSSDSMNERETHSNQTAKVLKKYSLKWFG